MAAQCRPRRAPYQDTMCPARNTSSVDLIFHMITHIVIAPHGRISMLRHAIRKRFANKYKVSSRMLALCAAYTGVLSGAPSLAADTSSDSAALEEVVVTANKLNAQRVLDIPVSIQAISGDTLQNIGASGIMSI